MKRKGFTLIELLAILVILAVILAIAVPTVSNIIKTSTKKAFESDAKMLLKAIDYKKMSDVFFDETAVNEKNIYDLLGLSNEKYNMIKISFSENVLVATIQGEGKWNGLVACGSYKNMKVVKSTTDCSTDLVPPIITMSGDNPVNIFVNEIYTDAGAIAFDNIDGDVTNKIVTTGIVNSMIPGTYAITYTVVDNGGNETIVTRTINVIDNVSPTITFTPNGNNIYAKNRMVTISVTDIGIIDEESLKFVWTMIEVEPSMEEFLSLYKNSDTINTPADVSGSYYLWAMASDKAGNKTVQRTNVFNLDNIAPIITITGDKHITINKGDIYADAGATASDDIDENIKVTSSGTVNPNLVGTYIITYMATDSSGNIATPVTRTINVVDASAPVITLVGNNPVNINVDSTYIDEGATALDDVDGDVTSRIEVTGTVDTSVAGAYIITYTVVDNSGNTSVATRTVNVIDNIPPTVVFGTNGNNTYAKSRSTTVTVSDTHTGVNTNSLKYLWNTSTATPSDGSFSISFTNGEKLNSPNGVSGSYYLWILVKDIAGNKTVQRTNVFNLDNVAPTVSYTDDIQVNVNTLISESFLKNNTTMSDNYSSINEISITNIVVKNSASTVVSSTLSGYDIYTISYSVVDKAGNATNVSRTMTTLPTTSITLTNLILDSSFETGGDYWYNVATNKIARVTEKSYEGSYSFRVTSEDSQTWPRYNNYAYTVLGKSLYSRVYTYKVDDTLYPGLAFITSEYGDWPTSMDYVTHYTKIPINQWVMLSATIPSAKATYFKIMLPQINKAVTGYVWFDGLMVIDLTESFGSNVPTKKWVNKMIPYFKGTKTFSW